MYKKNDKIGAYTVVFPIKKGVYAETYRVTKSNGALYFLKLINKAKLQHSQLNDEGKIVEIEISKSFKHHNICNYIDDGEFIDNGKQYAYLVTEFVSGETVAQRASREQHCSVYDTKQIALATLKALKYLHSLPQPVLHNEVTIHNLMLDLNGELKDLKLIDFGHAQYLNHGVSKPKGKGWDPFYLAPERFNGVACVQSDLYAVGCLIYHSLFGVTPWFLDLSRFDAAHRIEAILDERQKPLKMFNMDLFGLDDQLINTITKATSQDIDQRFQTADEFIKALTGENIIISSQTTGATGAPPSTSKKATVLKPRGNGFADVAGMDDLKERMRIEIINVLKDPERAKKFGITIPNGILLYGPPGCGKTFFAEKLAEEIGCNYLYIKCSDVASPYIHGGQGKIAAIFDEARKNAPTLLFLDEVDAMITDRSRHHNVSESGEVNEFLAQLNNCGEDRVTVIGATNKPDLIDEAALRTGRLALHYYIPQPNFEARKRMFEVNLKQRSTDYGIDYEKLASMTENYSSSDIKEIVDNAGRTAFASEGDCITQEMIEKAITDLTSHLTLEVIKKHEEIRDKFEQGDSEQGDWQKNRKMIGFKTHEDDKQ